MTESKRKSDGVNGACEQLKINANTLLNTACGDVKTEINTFANTVQTNIAAINDILNTMDFDSVQRDVDSTIDTTKEPLHIAMIVILSVALFCASMTTIMCIQHTCYEAGSISRCLVRSIATIMISTIFMVWTMSAVLLALSSAMADFCVNPANNIINVAGITDTTTKYFLRCNYVSPALVWPLQADTDAIISTINEAVNKITTVKTCYTTTTPQTCDQTCITGMEQQLNTTILNFMELNHSFVAEDGFFQQFACSTVNGLFQVTTYKNIHLMGLMLLQEVLNTLCGTAFDAIMASFEVILTFSVILAFIEFTKRKMPSHTFSIHS